LTWGGELVDVFIVVGEGELLPPQERSVIAAADKARHPIIKFFIWALIIAVNS